MERRARIIGTGRAVPDTGADQRGSEKMVDTSDEWITNRSGIKERRIAGKDEVLLHLRPRGRRRALDRAGVDPKSIDLILLATVTPDQPIPSTACFIQHMLGAVDAAAFDLSAGCTGFIYALSTADQFIRSGKYDTVLVIGERCSPNIRIGRIGYLHPLSRRRRRLPAARGERGAGNSGNRALRRRVHERFHRNARRRRTVSPQRS